jgi:large subunit ribosomal protein L27
MAKTKSAGSTKLGRDSRPKYLGVKIYAGQTVRPGQILIRQRGTKILAGENVEKGRDDTLYAKKGGKVYFKTKRKKLFDGGQRKVKIINIR